MKNLQKMSDGEMLTISEKMLAFSVHICINVAHNIFFLFEKDKQVLLLTHPIKYFEIFRYINQVLIGKFNHLRKFFINIVNDDTEQNYYNLIGYCFYINFMVNPYNGKQKEFTLNLMHIAGFSDQEIAHWIKSYKEILLDNDGYKTMNHLFLYGKLKDANFSIDTIKDGINISLKLSILFFSQICDKLLSEQYQNSIKSKLPNHICKKRMLLEQPIKNLKVLVDNAQENRLSIFENSTISS